MSGLVFIFRSAGDDPCGRYRVNSVQIAQSVSTVHHTEKVSIDSAAFDREAGSPDNFIGRDAALACGGHFRSLSQTPEQFRVLFEYLFGDYTDSRWVRISNGPVLIRRASSSGLGERNAGALRFRVVWLRGHGFDSQVMGETGTGMVCASLGSAK